ncbi:hypothetical protein DFP73DRAFT_569069 [Morchella snyderi]|nr:hypothetical protein DFP73DRAFT_569069 [Morchella snyderi]
MISDWWVDSPLILFFLQVWFRRLYFRGRAPVLTGLDVNAIYLSSCIVIRTISIHLFQIPSSLLWSPS